ncbi:hypothetical protein D3C80_1667850 [compost metagenome]
MYPLWARFCLKKSIPSNIFFRGIIADIITANLSLRTILSKLSASTPLGMVTNFEGGR